MHGRDRPGSRRVRSMTLLPRPPLPRRNRTCSRPPWRSWVPAAPCSRTAWASPGPPSSPAFAPPGSSGNSPSGSATSSAPSGPGTAAPRARSAAELHTTPERCTRSPWGAGSPGSWNRCGTASARKPSGGAGPGSGSSRCLHPPGRAARSGGAGRAGTGGGGAGRRHLDQPAGKAGRAGALRQEAAPQPRDAVRLRDLLALG